MWRKVHEADLTASLSLAEIDAFRQSADFEHDPVESQIRQVCSYVRGCIRSGGVIKDRQMAKDESALPESLISPAMDYLRWQILTRMNLTVNDSRTKAYDRANEIFDSLRRGEYIPEPDALAEADDSTKAVSPIAADATPPRLLD